MPPLDSLISFSDFLISTFYLIIIITISYIIKNREIARYPEYKYFIKGILLKILGVTFFCLIYVFYYGGGDTVSYFVGSKALAELFLIDFNKYYDIVINNNLEYKNFTAFNSNTWYPPWYMWKDPKTFSVCRFTSIFTLISFHSFVATSFLTACFSYIGIWKIYRLFNILYPGNSKSLAYLVLFLPTLVFWGGGIMKDSYVLGATCWITFNFYRVFIKREKIVVNTIFIVFNLFIIINTKAYVIISLLPGMLLWLNNAYLQNVKSTIGKFILFPLLISIISLIGFYGFYNLSSFMGVYGDVDTAIQQAQVIQEDLLREDQYGGNNYDLGELDGSFSGLISTAYCHIYGFV